MAWTTPATATAGSTALTAAFWNEQVRDNMLMGLPVFTNEAARDAVITAPAEGQMCYLTTPTVPAATGGVTAIPSGIRTIYNGSVWVCISEVAAYTTNTGTTLSTSFTTSLSGSPGTNPSVTLVTGTTVLVTITAQMGAGASSYAEMTFGISGASTIAASSDWGVTHQATTETSNSRTTVVTGLTAGTNTFTLHYKTNNASCSFYRRSIVARGVA